jgi:dihydrofolate reductase
LGWSNTHRLGSIDELRAVKEGDGPDLLIQGSSTLYPQLLAAGLLDRLTLMMFPAVLGGGKTPFGAGTPAEAMRMVDHQVTRSGAVIATYEPGGAIEHGWAGPQSTSGREQARQKAIAEGSW